MNSWPRRERQDEQDKEAAESGQPVEVDVWVTLVDLRAAIDKLLNAMESRFGPRLQFNGDFYWNVPFDEATAVHREPTLDLGSVMDDTQSVREFVGEDPSEYVSIWHEADHIAGVLRAIARHDKASSP